MQAYSMMNNLPSPQQTPCIGQPGPTSQSGYYSVQQRTSNQRNAYQPAGLNNGHSFSLQPHSSSANLQPSPVQRNDLPVPTAQTAHYGVQQKTTIHWNNFQSHGSNNGQYFQTNSGSANLQSSQPSQLQFSNVQRQMPYMANDVLLPSVIEDNQLHAAQPQQTSSPYVQVSQVAHRTSINQGQMRAVRNGVAYDSAAQPPAAAQAPPHYRSQHMLINHGQSPHNVNQVQNSLLIQNHSSPYRTQNLSQSQSSSIQLHHRQIFRDLLEKVRKRQELQRRRSVPSSGHHSSTSRPSFPAHQHNTELQGLQSNSTTAALPQTSTSLASFTSQAPLPTGSGPIDPSQVTLLELLLRQENEQVHNQGNSPPSFSNSRAQTVENRGGPQETASPATSVAVHSQAQASHYSVPSNSGKGVFQRVVPAPSTETGISVDKGDHLKAVGAEGAQSSRSLANRSNKQHREVEHCTDPAECLALVMALQRAARKSHRAVAVVPPISQQTDPGQKEDAPASPDDSLPCKIDAVWTLEENSKGMEKEMMPPSLLKEISMEASSVMMQETVKPGTGPTVNTQSDAPAEIPTGFQSFDILQAENGSTSKSHVSQAPVCMVNLTEGLEQQNHVPDESYSDHTVFGLSTVPVTDFTLEKLRCLVKFLEATTADKCVSENTETTTDVFKSILDLYWGGDLRNLLRERKAVTWLNTKCDMRVNIKQDIIFQYLEPELLKILPGCYVLENELPLLTQFKSSWLNVDGGPADIDKVLAEPISEYDFMWCKDAIFDSAKKPKVVQTSGQNAEDLVVSTQIESSRTMSGNIAVNPEHSLVQGGGSDAKDLVVSTQKKLAETTSNNAAKEIVDSDSCLSEPASPAVKEKSLQDPTNIQQHHKTDHQIQDGNTNPAGVFSSPLNPKSKPNEEALSNASSPTSLMMDIILLDSDDASTIFKKCDKQIGFPQEMSKVLPMLSVNQPNNLAGKAVRSSSHVMFTCPHVVDIRSDGDHFCSKCWEATPLLDVDLDESLFSPDEGGLPSVMSSPVRPVGETQEEAEEVFEPACSDNDRITGSVLFDPKIDGSEITRAPDKRRNLSPQSGTLPTVESVGPACSESAKPVVQDTCEVNSSAGEESPKAVAQTRPLALSSPKHLPCKKRKLSQTVSTSADDNLFSPDIVINAAQKQCPGVHSSSGGIQSSRDFMKEKGSGEKRPPIKIKIIPTNKHSSQTKTYVCKTSEQTSLRPQTTNAGKPRNVMDGCSPPSSKQQKRSCIKQAGLKKNIKNVKFLLFGSQSSDRDFVHRCHIREESFSAPVYIISQAGKNYGDMPSAKQKVYSQWSSSFVQKQNSSSHRKSHKKLERELKNRIEMQKQIMKERVISKPVKQKKLTKDLIHKEDHSTTQEPKTCKATIEDYFG